MTRAPFPRLDKLMELKEFLKRRAGGVAVRDAFQPAGMKKNKTKQKQHLWTLVMDGRPSDQNPGAKNQRETDKKSCNVSVSFGATRL